MDKKIDFNEFTQKSLSELKNKECKYAAVCHLQQFFKQKTIYTETQDITFCLFAKRVE